MDCEFTNYLTKNDRRLENIRVRSVTLELNSKKILVDIVFKESLSTDVQERLKELCEKYIGMQGWELTIFAEKSRYNATILEELIWNEIQSRPSIASMMDASNIKINGREVEISCDERLYNHFSATNYQDTLTELLNKNFCETFVVSITRSNQIETEELVQSLQTDFVVPVDDSVDRRIKVVEVEQLIGELFGNEAFYIKDITYDREVVLCGRISGIKELVAKRTNKPFFVFVLTDPTGSMEVVHFPSKNNLNKIKQLANGNQVIIKGKASQDNYSQNPNNKTSHIKFKTVANSIAYCKLPHDFEEVIYKKEVPSSYKVIYPMPFVSNTIQLTFSEMLSPKKEVVPQFFIGKTFVVFDLETTGTDRAYDRITEIGGIKVVDGKPTEFFETLIDPEVMISQDITKLTGIDNHMVVGKPKIADVIGDFYKFCDGAILVAHNAPFDISFISRFGVENGYFFNHETIDTLEMSRQLMPQNKYHSMSFLSELFGFVNKGAHRAINDCETLVDIFIELVKLREKQTG